MTNDECVDLGSDIWAAIGPSLNVTFEEEGLTDDASKALVFAGLISTVAGHMLGLLGPEVARQILEQAKEGCSVCVRSQMTVVPK